MYSMFHDFLILDLFREKSLLELQECYKFYSNDSLCAKEIIQSYADEFYLSEKETKDTILSILSELMAKAKNI